MRRGRRLAIALAPRTKAIWRAALIALVALLTLDFALPPPLERARVASSVVTDHDGVWLRAFATPDQKWRLRARLDEIDPEFLRRLVRIEDARFWLHPGVDPLALARAAGNWALRGEITSGGSTITMQLARLIEPRPRTVPSKLIEIIRALQIERRLRKREILELYLTLAPYGGNLEGVRAASRAYFARDPQGLSDAEIALLIALPQAPEARRPDRRPEAAKAARAEVLGKLVRAGLLTNGRAQEADQAPIPGRTPFPIRAYQVAERLAGGARGDVRSTLDAGLQTALDDLLRRHLQTADPAANAAVLAVEIAGRRVRASVGGGGWTRPGGHLDMTRAVRSPGSTLKPFIYALAFDDGLLDEETLIEDAPRRFSGYLPENFDRRFHGEVRAREALIHSLNLPAVSVLNQIGPARLEATLRAGGTNPRLPDRAESEPGLALALGGVGMSLEELATLYAALGDGGVAAALRYVEGPSWPRTRRLMRPDTAQRILAILADTPAPRGRAPSALAQGAPRIAFKTGTSYGNRDSWAVGVAQGHVIAVWVGRADGAPMPGGGGRLAALPILFDAFDRLAGAPSASEITAPAPVPDPAPGLARLEAGSERGRGPVILFPPNGASVMLAGLGPAGRGLSLSARGGAAPHAWYVDGAPVAAEPTSGRAIWRPEAAGFYDVMVIDAAGRRAQAQVRVTDAAARSWPRPEANP